MGAAEVAALLMDELEVGLGDTLREESKKRAHGRDASTARAKGTQGVSLLQNPP